MKPVQTKSLGGVAMVDFRKAATGPKLGPEDRAWFALMQTNPKRAFVLLMRTNTDWYLLRSHPTFNLAA